MRLRRLGIYAVCGYIGMLGGSECRAQNGYVPPYANYYIGMDQNQNAALATAGAINDLHFNYKLVNAYAALGTAHASALAYSPASTYPYVAEPFDPYGYCSIGLYSNDATLVSAEASQVPISGFLHSFQEHNPGYTDVHISQVHFSFANTAFRAPGFETPPRAFFVDSEGTSLTATYISGIPGVWHIVGIIGYAVFPGDFLIVDTYVDAGASDITFLSGWFTSSSTVLLNCDASAPLVRASEQFPLSFQAFVDYFIYRGFIGLEYALPPSDPVIPLPVITPIFTMPPAPLPPDTTTPFTKPPAPFTPDTATLE